MYKKWLAGTVVVKTPLKERITESARFKEIQYPWKKLDHVKWAPDKMKVPVKTNDCHSSKVAIPPKQKYTSNILYINNTCAASALLK